MISMGFLVVCLHAALLDLSLGDLMCFVFGPVSGATTKCANVNGGGAQPSWFSCECFWLRQRATACNVRFLMFDNDNR